jgi:hypothetical protein
MDDDEHAKLMDAENFGENFQRQELTAIASLVPGQREINVTRWRQCLAPSIDVMV